MRITYHSAKRVSTLRDRGLDFEDAAQIMQGPKLTHIDDRHDYGELRLQTMGRLNGVLVMVVWTQRGDAQHIISMRRCNDREERKFGHRLV